MSVEGGRQRLYGALKEFRMKWAESESQWKDPASQMLAKSMSSHLKMAQRPRFMPWNPCVI